MNHCSSRGNARGKFQYSELGTENNSGGSGGVVPADTAKCPVHCRMFLTEMKQNAYLWLFPCLGMTGMYVVMQKGTRERERERESKEEWVYSVSITISKPVNI